MTQHESHGSHHHIVPVAYYVKTFVALLFLTVITVAASRVDFGAFNIVIAMLIAIVKAALVCLFFMGLRWDKGVNAVFFLGSFVFLGIFIGFTVSDIHFRPSTDSVEGPRFGFKQPLGFVKDAGHGGVVHTETTAQHPTANAAPAGK